MLSSALAFISAFISYLLMLHTISKPAKEESFLLIIFRYMVVLFVITFCVWAILNITIQLSNVALGIIIWLILIIIVAIKKWFK